MIRLKLLSIESDDEIGPIIVINLNNKKYGFCFCHRKKDRTIWFFGLERFFCSRCLGILLGGFTGIFLAIIGYNLNIVISFLFLIPLIIDGLLQAYGFRESNNLIRIVTGFLFGFGLQSIIGTLVIFLKHILSL
jgi:uncharacterized membrane protein